MHSLINMKKLFILIFIALVLATVSVVLWFEVFNATPTGWVKHNSNAMGFELLHPQEATVRFSQNQYGQPGQWVMFVVTKAPDSGLSEEGIFYDGLWLSVQRLPLQNQTLEQIATQRSSESQSTLFAGLQGYTYLGDHDQAEYEFDPPVTLILIPAAETEYFEISHAFADPTSQGYEKMVQQMLSSFEVTQTGGVSVLVWIFGILIVVGILVGTGLLIISKPN